MSNEENPNNTNNTPPSQGGLHHTIGIATGAIAGAVVIAAAAPVVLPLIGLGAVGTAVFAAVPWAGAAIGGWLGHTVTKP